MHHPKTVTTSRFNTYPVYPHRNGVWTLELGDSFPLDVVRELENSGFEVNRLTVYPFESGNACWYAEVKEVKEVGDGEVSESNSDK